MSVQPLKLAEDHTQQSVVARLREILAQAELGEIVGFAGITELRGGTYKLERSATLSRLQMAGALLDAAVAGLQAE